MLEVRNLSKTYHPKKGVPQRALDGVSAAFEESGMVFILGKSGSGKSTLLNLLGGLDTCDSGEIIIKGKSSKNFTQGDFDSYRNTYVGFIFQEYNVLEEFSVARNIGLALELQHKKATPEAVGNILRQVELLDYADRKPNELSGGQKQRVAIARALIKNPDIILADEPSGALDSVTGRQVFETLKRLSGTKLVLVVSHDRETADRFGDRIIELADGKIVSDIKKVTETAAETKGLIPIDSSVIRVRKGYQLTQEDLQRINGLLKVSEGDVLISADAAVNKSVNKFNNVTESGGKISFEKTSPQNLNIKKYYGSDFKSIKSRLPFKDSLRLGASGLKQKRVRLSFAIILACISFSLFGLFDTIAAYNRVTTTMRSLADTGVPYAGIVKRIQDSENSDRGSRLTQKDIDEIKARFPAYKFQPFLYGSDSVYGMTAYASLSLYDTNRSSYYGQSIVCFSETGNIADLGASFMTAGSRLPQNGGEIAVSKFTLESFIKFGYRGADNKKTVIASAEDLIGKQISFYGRNSGKALTVCGVFDPYIDLGRRYDLLKEDSSSITDTVEMISAYVLSMELDSLVSSTPLNAGILYPGAYEAMAGSGYNLTDADYRSYTMIRYNADSPILFLDGRQTKTLAEDEIILSLAAFSQRDGGIVVPLWFLPQDENFKNAFKERLITFLQSNKAKLDINSPSYDSAYDISYNGSTSLEQRIETAADTLAGYLVGGSIDFIAGTEIMKYAHSLTSHETVNVISAAVCIDAAKNADPSGLSALYSVNSYYDSYARPQIRLKIAGISIPQMLPGEDFLEFLKSYNTDYSAMYNQKLIAGLFPDDTQAVCDGLFVKLNLDGSDKALISFSFAQKDSIRFKLVTPVSGSMDIADEMLVVISKVFLWVAAAFLVFASLLLINFISASVAAKKREIGILRALGARSSDVFMIFLSESMIIALINFVLAVALTVTGCFLLNMLLRTQAGLMLTILNFGIRQVFLLLGISSLVALAATFIPVFHISRKKPIDAIRDK